MRDDITFFEFIKDKKDIEYIGEESDFIKVKDNDFYYRYIPNPLYILLLIRNEHKFKEYYGDDFRVYFDFIRIPKIKNNGKVYPRIESFKKLGKIFKNEIDFKNFTLKELNNNILINDIIVDDEIILFNLKLPSAKCFNKDLYKHKNFNKFQNIVLENTVKCYEFSKILKYS